MNNTTRWFCATCFKHKLAASSELKHDGRTGLCVNCNTRVISVRHQCYNQHPTPSQFQWLLLQGIGAVCPSCKAVINLAHEIETLPSAPDWLKSLAEVAAGVSVVVGGGLLLGAALDLIFPAGKT